MPQHWNMFAKQGLDSRTRPGILQDLYGRNTSMYGVKTVQRFISAHCRAIKILPKSTLASHNVTWLGVADGL